MAAVLLLHAVLGAGLVAAGDRLGRRGAWIALLAPIATLAWLASVAGPVLDGDDVTASWEWMAALDLRIDLRLDAFAVLMLLLVAGVGTTIFTYSARYLPSSGSGIGRLVGLLVSFGGAMVGLVLADHLLVLYAFWELTSITSFLLIGNDHERPQARAAALHALLVTGLGGLAMLGGFLVLGAEAGTYSMSELLADPPTGGAVDAALALVLLGAFTKSAQYPFHAWLPGAMVAPTPVSAYLHSATMVKAGVYLVARFSPAFAPVVPWWRPVVVGVGLVTMVAGGLRAIHQRDLKVLLAHGTVSQLGFLMAAFGIATPAGVAAGCVLLLAHGAFKAANFLTVGIVDHQFGTRDVDRLPRLDRSWAPVGVAAVAGAASMAGVPLLFGFIAKEAVLQAELDAGGGWWDVAVAALVLGSVLTAGYSARFAWGALGRSSTRPVEVHPSEVTPGPVLLLPLLALTAVTLVLGLVPGVLDGTVTAAETSLHRMAEPVHLVLWHGFTPALGLSALALAGGLALFLTRRRWLPVARRPRRLPDAQVAYQASLSGLNAVARRATAVAQPGSMPIYAGVILTTAALLPLWGLLVEDGGWTGWPGFVDTPAHVFVVAIILGAALAAAAVRRRFAAALFLGIVGYAMAALFVTQGAPDLALTQVAIETLSTVLFVLVLRRLPDRFVDSGGRRPVRVLVAGTVAVSVFVVALAMGGIDPPTPASDTMVERAEPDGHGRNVVNVILVDFRALDTLGEITVLASAAIGTVALARAGRVPAAVLRARRSTADGSPPEQDDGTADPAAPLVPASVRLTRLVNLDVSVRLVFAAVIVGSVYLLFAGHNQPGGGFVGGILAGAALALRYVAGGISEVRRLSRARPWTVLGAGLAIAGATAAAPLVLGSEVLDSAYASLDLPLVGKVSLTSVMVFDAGVYLAVLGLALMVFESFGDDPEAEPGDAPPGRAPVAGDSAGGGGS